VTDAATILKQIKEIRRKGYGVSWGESVIGAACICAPVKNYFCPVALYVVGPEDRIKPKLDIYINALVNSAHRISEDIVGVFNG
jgi:DNA-binding IclR family transcriptional regulator